MLSSPVQASPALPAQAAFFICGLRSEYGFEQMAVRTRASQTEEEHGP